MDRDLALMEALFCEQSPSIGTIHTLDDGPVDQFIPDLWSYERILVFHSGGKDGMAALLYLLDLGVPRSKIEIHHHDIDGREGSHLMDWPVTRSYVEVMGRALGIEVFFSWKQGGFERELLRENCQTAPSRRSRSTRLPPMKSSSARRFIGLVP